MCFTQFITQFGYIWKKYDCLTEEKEDHIYLTYLTDKRTCNSEVKQKTVYQ